MTLAAKIAALLRERGAAYAEFDDSATDGQCWIVETKDTWFQGIAEEIIHAVQHHDSTPVPAGDAVDVLRRQLDTTRLQLAATVMSACPGPHRPVQHRDRQPPWCAVCGRTSDGQLIKEPAAVSE